jgi:signal transduction histidine kinase/ligand-binding sensor domain-containing protein
MDGAMQLLSPDCPLASRTRAILLCWVIAACGEVDAYEPQRADPLLEPFRWHLITELTGKGVRVMAEGPDGVMWFGVDAGLLSYDGLVWKSYGAGQGIDGPVVSVCVTADGRVFAGNNRSIKLLGANSAKQVFPPTGDWAGGIYRLTSTPDGSLWAGTNFGLLRYKDSKLTLYGPQECLDQQRATLRGVDMRALPSLEASDDGMFPVYHVEPTGNVEILIRARDGIYGCQAGDSDSGEDDCRRLSGLQKLWHPIYSAVVCRAKDGSIWGLGDAGMVERIGPAGKQEWDLRKLLNGDVTVSITEGADGSIWVGGQGSLFRYQDEAWQLYSEPQIPIGGAARNTILAASDGALWIASSQSDVYRIDYADNRWLTLKELNFGAETADGNLWFISKQGQIVSTDKQMEMWQDYAVEDGLPDAPVTLYCTRQGRLWAVGSQGQDAAIAYFDAGRWHTKIFPTLSWSIDYRSVFEAIDGSMWFGAAANAIAKRDQTGGILRYDPSLGDPNDDEAWQKVPLAEPRTSTYGIGQTNDRRMWFGGLELYIYDFENNRRLKDIRPPFPVDVRIDDIHTTPDHRLWIATRNYGVASYDGREWRLFNVTNGLAHNTITTVTELANREVLLATDRDISRFDGVSWTNNALPREFNMRREGGQFRQTSDGAVWINIGSRGWKRRALDHDIYKPEAQEYWTCRYVPERRPPSTTITLFEDEVSSRGNTSISWTGADRWHVTDQTGLRYSYRFDGGAWSHFAPETQHMFTSLASGNHTFEVRARDMDFNVDPHPPKIEFHVAAPLWRQPWFVGLITITSLALLTSLRAYSARQRTRELEALNQQLRLEMEQRRAAELAVRASEEQLRHINVELEERVAERTSALQESNAELESFAHSVSHDLRAPLRAMEGFAIALEEDYGNRLDDEGREFITCIVTSARRLDTLISDLLNYSRLGRAHLSIQRVDLGQVVKEVIEHLKTEIAARKAIVQVEDRLPPVKGHQTTLVQVISNLVANALKFVAADQTPRIRIWAEQRAGDKIRLLVEDNGIGIDPSYHDLIFRIFERLHGIESFPGTGVGLAIVSRGCERLGGRCGVESAAGQGSRFWIELPMAEAGP